MTRPDPAAGADERDAARRLAEALDGPPATGVDGEALAVANLLRAVGGARAADELATARLRRALVAATRRRQGSRRIRTITAAAAALVLGVVAASLLGGRRAETHLAAREAEARAAVARVRGALATGRALADAQEEIVGVRHARLLDALDAQRFDGLRRRWAEATVESAAGATGARRVAAESTGGVS